MWIKWQDGPWEDGRQAYDTGKICELPDDIAKGYIRANRAIEVKQPISEQRKAKKKRPSARKNILVSGLSRQESIREIADLLSSEE